MELPIFKDQLADHWSRTCKHEFELMTKLKNSFGDRFDELNFMNHETGQFMKGSELRDCQTGCEIQEKKGFHKFGSFAELQQCGCKQFDEQLQFVNDKDKPLSNVDYCVTRADGMKVKGTTDNAGKTKRIKNTQNEMAIEKVEFFATKWTQPLCPQNHIQVGTLLACLDLTDVKTTEAEVGSSVKKVTVKGEDRPLTSGEIEMAKPVFKDSINYGEVKVHNGKYWLMFGLQPDDCATTPNGEMYFPESKFSEDFSVEGKDFKIWFMHEMAHIWQYQLGLWIKLHAAALAAAGGYKNDDPQKPPFGYRYNPATDKDKTLPDFNFEQQAEIISHYYAAKYLKDDRRLPNLLFYENVLKNFLVKPKDKGLLPREKETNADKSDSILP